ncbi:MAG: FG-GAP-like repeat-containing protein, partial [Terriglobales bacterium]
FKEHASYATGYEPGAVITGDFNGDGKQDLAVANWIGSSVSVYLGKGNGTFEAPITTSVPNYASVIVAADFNGDHKLDLAVTSNSTNAVYILLGRGDGSFESPVTYSTPNDTIGIVAADFNRDGHIDLAIADTYGNDVYVMLGQGDGAFKAGMSFAAGEVPVELVAGDFNGDGILDLAVTDGPDCGCAYMSVLLGNGDGTFQGPLTTSIPGAGSIVAGDFNQDGKLDVAIDDGLTMIFLGNGNGTFQPVVQYGTAGGAEAFATGDFNRDGAIDLVITNFNGNNATNISTLLGNGDGTFGRVAAYATGTSPGPIVSTDFDGDGIPDLAVANVLGNNVSVFLGKGGGKFASAVNYSVSAAGATVSADFNGDGRPDIATLNYSGGTVSVILNQGDGTFGAYKDYSAGKNPEALVAGDFNRDGNIDLIVGNSAGLALLLGNGKGGFAAPVVIGTGLSPTGIAVGDFNHDGKLDLATVSFSASSSYVSVLLGNGDGTFGPAVNYSAGGYEPVAVMAEDFNHDGKVDLAVLTYLVSGISVLLGNGDGTFGSYTEYFAPQLASAFVAANFYGPKTLDLAVVGAGDSYVYFLAGDGKGHFGSPNSYFGGVEPVNLVAADFDKNGSTDVALTNSPYGTVTVLLNGAVMSLSSSAVSFPKTSVGSKSKAKKVNFSNPGTALASISSVLISGANAGDFSETNNCPASLAAGKSCAVDIEFQPTQKGGRSALLMFTDDALAGSQTVALTGTAQ